jgi:hypothetical protein
MSAPAMSAILSTPILRTGPRDRSILDAAKTCVDIPTAWRALGLPSEPHSTCRSPFRPDKKPSFSISANGLLWHDHATGEGGDAVSFIKQATGCNDAEAIRRVIELARGIAPSIAFTTQQNQVRGVIQKASPKPLRAPSLTMPTIGDVAEIQRVRSWPVFAGLEIAVQRGLLHCCTMTDDGVVRRAWAITDSARRSIQVRRMDGQPWSWNNAKAWTLGGSIAGWPIGSADIGNRRTVLFCEGGPDFLAAHTLSWMSDRADSVAVVCIPGATTSLHADALTFFSGRQVRIFEHSDAAGSAAGQRWSAQLINAGAAVDGYTFEAPHKDLADLLSDTDEEFLNCPSDIFEGLDK